MRKRGPSLLEAQGHSRQDGRTLSASSTNAPGRWVPARAPDAGQSGASDRARDSVTPSSKSRSVRSCNPPLIPPPRRRQKPCLTLSCSKPLCGSLSPWEMQVSATRGACTGQAHASVHPPSCSHLLPVLACPRPPGRGARPLPLPPCSIRAAELESPGLHSRGPGAAAGRLTPPGSPSWPWSPLL